MTEGNQTILTCTARGVPAPEFMWYRGSELINSSETRLQVTTSQVSNDTTGFIYVTSHLNISMVDRTDTILLRCEATNIVWADLSSRNSQSFCLTVLCELKCCKGISTVTVALFALSLVPPAITLNPGEDKALKGMSATFLCTTTGRPLPNITWYRTVDDSDTQERVDVSDVRVTVTEERNGQTELMSNLTLKSVLPSDAADYICHADNGVGDGMVRSSATLTVNGKWFCIDTVCTTTLSAGTLIIVRGCLQNHPEAVAF